MNSLVTRSSLSSAELTRYICGLADPADEFSEMQSGLGLFIFVIGSFSSVTNQAHWSLSMPSFLVLEGRCRFHHTEGTSQSNKTGFFKSRFRLYLLGIVLSALCSLIFSSFHAKVLSNTVLSAPRESRFSVRPVFNFRWYFGKFDG